MDEKFILAIVAASSAVGGVLLTQAFTLIRESIISKRANNSLLREKYELLADKLSESILHKNKFENICSEDIFSNIINQPIEKIFNLSQLYFPELIEPSRCYHNSYRDYCIIILENYRTDTGLSASMQAAAYAGDNLDLVIGKLDKSQKNLYDSIQMYAHKYARA